MMGVVWAFDLRNGNDVLVVDSLVRPLSAACFMDGQGHELTRLQQCRRRGHPAEADFRSWRADTMRLYKPQRARKKHVHHNQAVEC